MNVAICMERSLDLAVALLAVLKSGAACVPLDPRYPKDRLAFMLSDAAVAVLLTQASLRAGFPETTAAVVALDEEWDRIAGEVSVKPAGGAKAEDCAYVVYTSGSTGRPRGVELTHRGLVNHHLAAVKLYGLGPADRVLQFCSLSFDISIEEIFPTWISGGTVVMRPEDLVISGAPFLEWVTQRGITVMDLPTAFWHQWTSELESSPSALPASLRLVIVGGEKASPAVLAKWRQIAPRTVRWVNTYGPTEASIIATSYEPDTADTIEKLPIGRPIANVRLYVLDHHMEPVPIGVKGELHIGGDGVARGYLNQPALTAEKFVDSPFVPGEKLYRTGDLVKYLADGNIEFIGRLDDQVKIRGFRVEPQEIEKALCGHCAVQDALVMVREDVPELKELAAYYITRPGETVSASELRAFARDLLPDYMVPSYLEKMDAFPLTANGKVDRKALPAPDRSAAGEDTFVGPRTPVEEMLAEIWTEVLKRPRIGIHDNFFDSGGHSLTATQVMSRIASTFDLNLRLRTIFEAPTIAQLAEVIFQALSEEEPASSGVNI